MIILATGVAKLGRIETDINGNAVRVILAEFQFQDEGPCVAVIETDPETGTERSVHSIFGDWDAAGYLKMALEILNPNRDVNLPDFPAITKKALKDGVDLCDYCEKLDCWDCVVRKWKERTDERNAD